MSKTSNYVRIICEIGIFAALGFVLDELQGIISKPLFPAGGSIGFAMIAVLIIAFRRGFFPALIVGLIMGLFDIATSAYILHPAQLFLDYILPYAFVAVAGLLKPLFDKSGPTHHKVLWLISGTFIGGIAKFFSHYFAGVFFWNDPNSFSWGLNSWSPYLYSFVYNIAFIGPSIVLTGILLVVLYVRVPRIIEVENKEVQKYTSNDTWSYFLAGFNTTVGLFLFVYFLIKYIQSFSDYDDEGAYGYDFDPDSMVIFILGFFLAVLGIILLIRTIKRERTLISFFGGLTTIASISLIYGISRLIRMYVKGKDPTTYWIWFAVGLTVLVICTSLLLASIIRKKKANQPNL